MSDTDALLAIEGALTEQEREQILANAYGRWPRLRGAKVADVLDLLDQHDGFLWIIEPFFDDHLEELLKPAEGVVVGAGWARYVSYALILLDRDLTVDAVLELLRKAELLS